MPGSSGAITCRCRPDRLAHAAAKGSPEAVKERSPAAVPPTPHAAATSDPSRTDPSDRHAQAMATMATVAVTSTAEKKR